METKQNVMNLHFFGLVNFIWMQHLEIQFLGFEILIFLGSKIKKP